MLRDGTAWDEPGIFIHLVLFVVPGLELCFCINNGIHMKAEPTSSPQAPLCPLATQLDYCWSHCQVEFGLGHCLEGGIWRWVLAVEVQIDPHCIC